MSSSPLSGSLNPGPDWLDDSHINPQWLHQQLAGISVLAKSSCLCIDISNATRKGDHVRNGATIRVSLADEDGTSQTQLHHWVVLKQVSDDKLVFSQSLGLAREALFYSKLTPWLQGKNIVPEIYYAFGNMETGQKWIVMQDLSLNEQAVDSGIFFGPGNPNNWSRDLEQLVSKIESPPSAHEVASKTFLKMAQIHAKYWLNQDLLEYDWLRGSGWVKGIDLKSFDSSQRIIQDIWKQETKNNAHHQKLQWDPVVLASVEKAIQGISWEQHVARLHRHWTLVHGDFWPGNVLWLQSDQSVRLIDWEMVGIGSGPQDLGQYVISNMDPDVRRSCESELIQSYWNELQLLGVSDLPWEYCWHEYTVGGLERWLWFLLYFLDKDGPLEKWAQFFHDQISAFMHDHKMTVDMITQPRP
jgi:thiamine kinase-like enzyme